MRKAFAFSFAASAAAVVLNFLSGVISARALGADGRGALAVVQIVPSLSSWIFGMGASQALSYYFAKYPERRQKLLGSWLAIMAPCVAAALLLQLFILEPIIGDQTPDTLRYAQLWTFTVIISMYGNIINGCLLGLHRYKTFSALTLIPAAVPGVGYLIVHTFGTLTLGTALAIFVSGFIASLLLGAVLLFRQVHPSRPDMKSFDGSLAFGVKAHGSNFGQAMNGRLDLILMPSLTSPATVGLYSVATNVSWIIVQIAGAIYPLVTPAAVRDGEVNTGTVLSAMKATLLVGVVLGIIGGALAVFAVPIVYGSEFADAVLAIEILIPGAILFAASQVLWSGLYAVNKPLTSLVVQIPGLLVTAAGLGFFLERYGLMAASITSTVSYAVVFVFSLYAYLRVAKAVGSVRLVETEHASRLSDS